jgi:hypothetical protein
MYFEAVKQRRLLAIVRTRVLQVMSLNSNHYPILLGSISSRLSRLSRQSASNGQFGIDRGFPEVS